MQKLNTDVVHILIQNRVIRTTIINLLLLALSPNSECSHFYGEEMFADISANSTMETITVRWRIMWSYGTAPSTETLNTCTSGLGTPCAYGPTSIDRAQSNCVAHGINTVDGSASYDSWTCSDSRLYYPIGSVPLAVSTIGITFNSNSWGLIDSRIAYFGGQLIVMTSRRTDNNLFNQTPRSAVASIVTLWPNCGGSSFRIPVTDPDSDPFKCRWSSTTQECRDCCYNYITTSLSLYYPLSLSSSCTITYTGGTVSTKTYYPICIQMEDYYPSNPTVRISSASLQFVVEVAPAPCTMQVSPLVTDNCSIAMVIPVVATCSGSPASVAPNALIPSYSNDVGTSVIVTCVLGYTVVPSGVLNVTCVQYNSTSAAWVANAQCSCKRLFRFFK